jgi:hypothetical protein
MVGVNSKRKRLLDDPANNVFDEFIGWREGSSSASMRADTKFAGDN